jgi:hypothetical protein
VSDKVNVGSLQALIDFRSHLMRFNRDLADEYRAMVADFRSVPWDDDKRRHFGDALDEVGKGIERYLSVADEHEHHLLKLIERLDSFLKT